LDGEAAASQLKTTKAALVVNPPAAVDVKTLALPPAARHAG
jgi:hypothetical protein